MEWEGGHPTAPQGDASINQRGVLFELGASRGKSSARSHTAVPYPADVAAVAATAVLDVLMPHVVYDGPPARLVAQAAQTVHSSLVAAGASSEEALEASRRVSAEVALWMPRAWPVRSSEALDPELARRERLDGSNPRAIPQHSRCGCSESRRSRSMRRLCSEAADGGRENERHDTP